MTTALPSLHRASVFANNPTGLSSYPVAGIWPSSATDEGDGGAMLPGGGSRLEPAFHSAPQFMIPATPSSTSRGTGQTGLLQPPTQQQQQQLLPQCAQALQQQQPNAPESIHRFTRERNQAGGGSGGNGGGNGASRGPPAFAVMASGAPYVSYLPAASSAALGSPTVSARCLTPEQPRRSHFTSERSERSETVSGWPGSGGSGGGAASTILLQAPRPLSGNTAWVGGGGGGGGVDSAGRPGSPTPARMITHDVFVLNRPITSASNAGERRRLFTGASQELLRGTVLTNAPSMPLSSPPAAAVTCGPTGLAGGGSSGENRISRGRARGISGGAHSLSLSLPLAAVDATPVAGYQFDAGPYTALPHSACSPRSPSPRIIRIHPGGLGSAAMSIIASGHHISRQQVIAQARGVERLLALDVEDALARAPTPRQVATLTPGTLDGMGHPILLAADGSRILKRIPDHLPRHAAERMVATPMKPEQLSLALESVLDPDLDLDLLGHSHDGGDGSSSYDEADYLPSSRGTGAGVGASRIGGGAGVLNGILPYMSLGAESSVNGSMGLTGGGGGRHGARAGGGGRKGGGTIAGGAGGGDGSSPQRMARSWSSPSRQPRGGGGAVHSRTETLDGSGAGAAGGGVLAAESSRASRIGVESRGGVGNKQRRRSRSPINAREGPAAGGRVSPGRASPPGRGSGGANGGRSQSIAGEDTGPPKWLGTYIPKEDPLGLWTGKRMSKTEVIVEKRLFAMRHNPGMRLELESRAAEALRQRAAAQAEMAAVTRAREEEASARKAQLRAEIEAHHYGYTSPREMERGRSRTPRGFTKEARAALERQLLAEAEAEPRGPLSRVEAATIIQSTWRMYRQRQRFLYIRSMVIRIQRAARLRYCVIRNRRRHAAAATLLLEFLCAMGGSRHATAAMDLREIHSNYIRRRLLEKKGDLRHQTAVAVLVREWESVEARILGLRSRSLKGSALAALAASGFTTAITGGGGGSGGGGGLGGHHPGTHHRAAGGGAAAAASTGSGGGSPDKDMLTAVAGEAHSAAHGTRLLGKALEARKKGVMLLGGGKDLNKQLTVEYAVAHAMATDRVTLTSRETVPSEVKALVSSCYLEHKSTAYTTFIGVVWRRRARWFAVFNQQRHMAMARSVVETGSAWRAMDTLAKESTEKLVGLLPVLPRMRTSATLRELRALMQAGVQEADLYTSYMLKGGIHELERRLHSEMLLRNSFGHMLRGGGGHRESRDTLTPPNAFPGAATAAAATSAGVPPSSPLVDGSGAGGGDVGVNRRLALNLGSLFPASTPPGQRRVSVAGSLACGGPVGQSPLAAQSSTTSLSQLDSPRRTSRTVRIDAAAAGLTGGGSGGGVGGGLAPLAAPDAFLDTVSEAGSEMTSVSNVSAMAGTGGGGGGGYAAAGLARARFFSIPPGQKAGVAQLKERWWRDAVVRVDACLRKRYKLNGVSLVASLEDPMAPNLELFSTKLAEINSNPEKAETLLAALPGGAAAGTA
ncbi:hypothetical protein VaNZ11_012857, partial [Volvox africanus]